MRHQRTLERLDDTPALFFAMALSIAVMLLQFHLLFCGLALVVSGNAQVICDIIVTCSGDINGVQGVLSGVGRVEFGLLVWLVLMFSMKLYIISVNKIFG